ncbi:MAG: DUF4913 domain-containing protein [Candidatus Nanopelagicales bacterium]
MSAADRDVAAVADLAAQVDALRITAECGVDLATRLDTLEHDVANLQVRLETLAVVAAVGQPGEPSMPAASGYQYTELDAWVDDVFARLAARHQVRWCSHWEEHFEAVARLRLLWHTWEASHTEPADYRARDEWARVVFDHHAPWLLNREGPFAGCTPDRCATAPRLPQRDLGASTHGLVASLGAYQRARAAAGGVR